MPRPPAGPASAAPKCWPICAASFPWRNAAASGCTTPAPMPSASAPGSGPAARPASSPRRIWTACWRPPGRPAEPGRADARSPLPSRQTDHGTMPGTAAVWCFFHARTEVLPRREQGPASGAPFLTRVTRDFSKYFLTSRPFSPPARSRLLCLIRSRNRASRKDFSRRGPLFLQPGCPNTSVQVSFSARDLPLTWPCACDNLPHIIGVFGS